jgi:hypothetical protein
VTSMTALAQPMAMATTELAPVIPYDVSAPRPEQNTGHTPRMNWYVVTDRVGMPWVGRGRLLRANKEMRRGEQE